MYMMEQLGSEDGDNFFRQLKGPAEYHNMYMMLKAAGKQPETLKPMVLDT
jgi:hypothetical protein